MNEFSIPLKKYKKYCLNETKTKILRKKMFTQLHTYLKPFLHYEDDKTK